MTARRLALLRADDHHHRYLESLLAGRFDLALVVVEPERERVAALRRRRRYRDWAYRRYHGWRRTLTGTDRYRRDYFAHAPELWAAPSGTRLHVRSVNDDVVVDALRSVAADVVVVIGCAALSKATLAAAGPLVIDVRGGPLPEYRSNHCLFFFPGHDGRLDRAGATIHRVHPGVAARDLIEIVRPPLDGDELPEHLYCRADLMAIHRLAGWLDLLERGGELPSPPQPEVGHTYRTRGGGPTSDLRYLLSRCARIVGLADPAPAAGQQPGTRLGQC